MVSLLICTHNRCESLKDILASLAGQKTDKDFDFEILVVDNASTDETKVAVEFFRGRFNSRLRYLYEPQKGKPHAMNLGIKEAQGDIIAFTDDDCLIEDEEFLSKIAKTFREQGSAIGFIGGKILPKWLGGPAPEWVTQSFMGPLALLDYGSQPFILDKNLAEFKRKLFYGANFAFRKELLLKYGGFKVDKTLAQDTDICLRLVHSGEKGLYAPDIRVLHKVPAQRLTSKYFYEWFYKRGIYRDDDEKYTPKFYHPFGVPFWLVRQTLQFYFKSLFSSQLADRIHYRCWAYFNLGRMMKLAKGTS
ncbi:MAG: hypothetical protein A3D10_06190 [Omnitrophica WOR_2 bacterium RIFCSPHIGHO2_02_FULL_48_11]|nr:MAG: hypothetical protein A3D10_06190 [Omnitrophica WOR_2 bacterium RIFCSPHIGHO2_02_FULL_48_11]